MSRSPVVVREADPADASALLDVWSDLFRRTATDRSGVPTHDEAQTSLARVAADPDQRLMVALHGEQVVGAAFLTRAPVTPLHPEPAVHISHLEVRESARKHGVGRLLVDAAVSWAEEKGLSTVLAAATAQSRDANRFFARLGFGQLAVIRAASVSSLRAGPLPLEPPACARTDVRTTRAVSQILAKRRSQRRATDPLG